jgi:hypothetical protein
MLFHTYTLLHSPSHHVSFSQMHADARYLRPAHKEPGRVLCVDALALSAHAALGPGGSWSTRVKMITCNPDRPTQQWSLGRDGRIANPHTSLCAEAVVVDGAKLVVMRACSSSEGGQQFIILPFEGDGMPY